jgi:hypothetical protein
MSNDAKWRALFTEPLVCETCGQDHTAYGCSEHDRDGEPCPRDPLPALFICRQHKTRLEREAGRERKREARERMRQRIAEIEAEAEAMVSAHPEWFMGIPPKNREPR